MRLLAVTIAAGLAVSACASPPSATGSGAEPSGRGGSVAPSGSPGSVGPGGGNDGTEGSGWVSYLPLPDSKPTAAPTPVDTRCPAGLTQSGQFTNSQAKPVPSGIEVDWVLRCTVTDPHGDHSRSLVIERSDTDPSALLAALRAPDEPRNDGPCPAIAMVVPYFALVPRDGKPLVARMPLTACSLPQAAAMQALDGLQWKVLAKKPLP
jgi:hypothetical protein